MLLEHFLPLLLAPPLFPPLAHRRREDRRPVPTIWKTAENETAERKLRRQDDRQEQQGQDEDDRAGSIQILRQERRKPLTDQAARAKLLAAELDGAKRERQKRRHAAEEQGSARQLGVDGVERPAPEVVPADDDEHQRNDVCGVSEQLVRELREERPYPAGEIGRASSDPVLKNQTGSEAL